MENKLPEGIHRQLMILTRASVVYFILIIYIAMDRFLNQFFNTRDKLKQSK
jgi:hypothetical protein